MSSKSGGRKKSQNEYSVIADNRKATFQYEIEDTFEAGIVLTGSEIKSIRQNKVKINGVEETRETTYPVMFDRIEAGTYLIAAAVTEGNLKINNLIPSIIKTEINILKKIGAKIRVKKNEVHIIGNKKIKSMNIKTAPYPGFPTDLQAQIMVLLCKGNNKSLNSP